MKITEIELAAKKAQNARIKEHAHTVVTLNNGDSCNDFPDVPGSFIVTDFQVDINGNTLYILEDISDRVNPSNVAAV